MEEYTFFYLAYDSLHCAEEMIEPIHAANVVVSNNNSAQFNTLHDVVPESPVSRSAAGENTHE